MMIIPDNVLSLVCDDIRREDNGKVMLIGVYVGEILVPAFPTELRLSVWSQWKSPSASAEPLVLDLKVELEGEKPLQAKGTVNGPLDEGDDVFLTVFGVPVKATKPTTLKLSAKIGGTDDGWRELARKRIELTSIETIVS